MTDYEIYVFLLCLIVFIMLTSLSVVCLCIITRLSLRLIDSGAEDESILKEYKKNKNKKAKGNFIKFLDYAVSGAVCLLFVVMLAGSLLIRCTENSRCGMLPSYRVVHTGSMAKANVKNTYISKNHLTDQIQMFDLIKTEKLPAEKDLKLYDIVVYEVDDMLIVHRIVGIEESNSTHPNCRYFLLQGDAVEAPDRFPVLYEQMKAIYKGERTPFIGSFILFMQSPAGWMCTLLIVVTMIGTPILDNKLKDARNKRLLICLTREAEADDLAMTGGGY